MNTVVFHPWASLARDTDNPVELRIDLDPQPGTDFADAAAVAPAVVKSGAPLVQIGAFDSGAIAESEWSRVSGRYGDLFSGKSPLAAAIRYGLTRMVRMRPYLAHGILELDNNTAERGMRAIALGRKNYLFVGSEAGGNAAAIAYTLIETAKLNAVDPHAWLADTLARIPDYKITKVDDLMPWRWNG